MTASASRRWILASALGVIAAAAIALAIIWRLGLDAYRGRIEQLVSRTTGHPFHLLGPIELRFAPLAVVTGPAVLDGPPGMPGPALASWSSARIRLQLLPLLRRRLVIEQVRLDGLQVHLQRDSHGQWNWSGLDEGSGSSGGGSIDAVRLGGLEVRGGEIDLDDRLDALRARLSGWRLDVGPSRLEHQLEIGPVRTSARMRSTVLPAELTARIDLGGATIGGHPPALTVPRWTLEVADARQAGSTAVARLDGTLSAVGSESPALHGELTGRIESVRGLMALLGLAGWHAPDPEALGTLTLAGRWSLAHGALGLESLRMHLDATTLAGSIVRRPVEGQPLIELDLHGDRIDLDRYLAGGGARGKPFELPVAALRALRIAGSVTFDEARFGGVELQHARLAIPAPGRARGLRP